MRSVACQYSELDVVDDEMPKAGPGQLVIDVERCGICGTDLHARVHYDQLSDAAVAVGYESIMKPDDRIVFGHEIVGRVASYGPGTRAQWKPGTLVVGLPICKHGDTAHAVGFDTASPGAYAEQVVLQEAFTFAVPAGVPAEKAAFTEPMAVALHAVRRGSVGRGQTAVVVGCGPIGLAVILMLKASGVKKVIASDLSPTRRELAVRCGADVVVDPREQDPLTVVPTTGAMTSFSSIVSFGI